MPFNTKHHILTSIDIGGTYIKYGAVLFSQDHSPAEVLWHEKVPSLAQDGVEVMLATITTIVTALLKREPCATSVGIGIPGVVDPTTRLVQNPPNLKGWRNIDLLDHIRQSPLTTSLPVFVENDANCGAIAELHAGAGKGLTDFVYITLGTGVGGGIVMNGKLYVGPHGEAGEIGHVLPGAYPGRILEDIVGNKGIVERYGQDVTVFDIEQRATQGDRHALHVLTETGTLIGESLCSVLAVLGMRTIIVGGGVSNSSIVMNAIRKQVEQIPIPTIRSTAQVLSAHFLDHAGLVGAALLGVA